MGGTKTLTWIGNGCWRQGDVGDVVVGRITEVGQSRWRVDVNGRQDAVLQLGAVNLPGGAARRRTLEDQLQMRSIFVEHDDRGRCAELFCGWLHGTASHTRTR
jgi:exosome complex component RRP4